MKTFFIIQAHPFLNIINAKGCIHKKYQLKINKEI